jgi:hypothetical protein
LKNSPPVEADVTVTKERRRKMTIKRRMALLDINLL